MTRAGYFPLAGLPSCDVLPPMTAPQEESLEQDLTPGSTLDGRFVIRARVSRTRRSTLYRGTDRENADRPVAIKVPLLNVQGDPIGYTRFQREESIGLRLGHPGLLRFVTVPRKTGRPYLVTEFLEGCTLADLLRSRRLLPERDALQIAAGIAEALADLHQAGVVHRDLKPANVVLCRDRTLRVIDFGEAAPVERKRSVLATVTPIVCTPEYLAPEQFEHRPNDERTDIYSLGVILYEMLTGVNPFPCEDRWDSAFQRTTGDPVAPRRLVPALSPAAEEIVLHALQRVPEQRYASILEFAGELRSPERVRVTGYATRLQAPRLKLSFHGTPLLAGTLLGLGALAALLLLFLALVALHRAP